MTRTIAALLVGLAIAACAPREPPENHVNFDERMRLLKMMDERTLIEAMGGIPDRTYALDADTKILRWQTDSSYWDPGEPPAYAMRNGVWTPVGGIAPRYVREGCVVEWTIDRGKATRYRWEGWGCKARPVPPERF